MRKRRVKKNVEQVGVTSVHTSDLDREKKTLEGAAASDLNFSSLDHLEIKQILLMYVFHLRTYPPNGGGSFE